MAADTVVHKPGEGDAYWMLGGLYEVLASGEQTGGAVTVIQMTLPAGAGPPPHTHPGTESVYVVEGKIRYHIGDDVIDGDPGSFFRIPEGTLEFFEPVIETKLVVAYSPGGIEQFFAEAGEPAANRELPPPPEEAPDLAAIAAIGARYGMDIQAPG